MLTETWSLWVQVYTGYFWFCTVYFVLGVIMTHIMMRYPPLGQQRSTWMAWVKVNARHRLRSLFISLKSHSLLMLSFSSSSYV